MPRSQLGWPLRTLPRGHEANPTRSYGILAGSRGLPGFRLGSIGLTPTPACITRACVCALDMNNTTAKSSPAFTGGAAENASKVRMCGLRAGPRRSNHSPWTCRSLADTTSIHFITRPMPLSDMTGANRHPWSLSEYKPRRISANASHKPTDDGRATALPRPHAAPPLESISAATYFSPCTQGRQCAGPYVQEMLTRDDEQLVKLESSMPPVRLDPDIRLTGRATRTARGRASTAPRGTNRWEPAMLRSRQRAAAQATTTVTGGGSPSQLNRPDRVLCNPCHRGGFTRIGQTIVALGRRRRPRSFFQFTSHHKNQVRRRPSPDASPRRITAQAGHASTAARPGRTRPDAGSRSPT